MEIKLVGALDYKKVRKLLENTSLKEEEREKLIEDLEEVEVARRSEIVSSAGRLSRFAGNVFEILGISEDKTLAQNVKYASMVSGLGHNSITDHDYLVLAIKDVSVLIEQIIIEERFASFTIKSRREVDFSNVGFYNPFDEKEQKTSYDDYTKSLFDQYHKLIEKGIKLEDARYVLPYNFHSNILMGIDAHTLKDMIIKCSKRKNAKIKEVREFGDALYKIAKKHCPYIIEEIDKEEYREDEVGNYLEDVIEKEPYQILEKPKLLSHTENVDDTILVSAIMRRYQYPFEKAYKVYQEACKSNPNFKEKLMKKIAFEGDKLELSQASFQFQIPLSYAVLTHLTRHRTHHIMVPDFYPNPDLTQYKTPPKIRDKEKALYDSIFEKNQEMYQAFKKKYQLEEEDLVYFTLAGNMTNAITNMDGASVEHILRLRECNKAQWEIREAVTNIHKEIEKLDNTEAFRSILGSTCVTRGICNEGKECCGKVYTLKK